MSFIRPEARRFLYRIREVLAGLVLLAVGLVLGLSTSGVAYWLAVGILVLGGAVFFTGLQRARIRPREGGRGVVELDEGALRYLTPEGGAVIALPTVTRIEIETTDEGPVADDLFWIFTTPETTARIPASAHGSEKLIDALAAFPGASYEQVIAASGSTGGRLFIIWQKARPLLH